MILELAASTQSAILHVMIADKISATLRFVIGRIVDYVNGIDEAIEKNPDLKEIELELLSALANDNALHIEGIFINCLTTSAM
jgi:hypothetical protein